MGSFVVRASKGARGFLPWFAPLSCSFFTVLHSIRWCSVPAVCPARAALGDLAAWPGPRGHFTLVLLTWTQHAPELAFTPAPHTVGMSTPQPQPACAPEGVSRDLPSMVTAKPRLPFTVAPQPPACPTPSLGSPGLSGVVSSTGKGCTFTLLAS
ncbi:hypothetical protein HJG60_010345 [Phyllostomus discolor]|uniref:Uncharacterized protein n=1 Tax=Phyllostomus discolor TaxID=89673 RepID=A0A834AYH2_9CHIR|nr:hypothetical protein HJG60_010345 [Phyllostomus discolor]